MSLFLPSAIFAIALSLDGFGVGLSYGMRKIRIPWKSLLIISIASALALAFSMIAGQIIASFLSKGIASFLGGLALILVGGWLLLQGWSQRLAPKDSSDPCNIDALTVFKFHIPSLGLVISILKEPSKADFDESGTISVNEAIFLGFALAMDALGAGLGAAMMGFSPWFTPFVLSGAKFILVSLGLYLGSHFIVDRFRKNLGLLPGMIIIALGIIQLF